jgi:hypothetical protein
VDLVCYHLFWRNKSNEDVKDHFKAKGLDKAKEVLDYLSYSEEEKREYEYYKESLHYQASMYESTYIVGRMEGKLEGKLEGEKIGIAKGEQIGKIITLQENIAEILTIRFQFVPDTVKTKISAIHEVSELNSLLKKAMTVLNINDLFDS